MCHECDVSTYGYVRHACFYKKLSPTETGCRLSVLKMFGIRSRKNKTLKNVFQNQCLVKFCTTNKLYSPVFHFLSFLSVRQFFHKLSPGCTGQRAKGVYTGLQHALWHMHLKTEIPLLKKMSFHPHSSIKCHILIFERYKA